MNDRKASRKSPVCRCDLCRLGRCLARIAKKCNASERAALNALWDRMEAAEMDMDWLIVRAQAGAPLEIGGRIYKPHNQGRTAPTRPA